MNTPQHIYLALFFFTSIQDDTDGKERVLLSFRKSSSVCKQLDIFKAEREIPPPVKRSSEKISSGPIPIFRWNKCDTERCFPFAFDTKKPGWRSESQSNEEDNTGGVTVRRFGSPQKTRHVRPPHVCERQCSEDPKERMTCHFNFTAEYYYSMSYACKDCPRVSEDCLREGCEPLNGVKKAMAVINRRLPGPPIRVCQHDTIVVDVTNKLEGDGLTIHWHGLEQIGSPSMDGVPQVTQCYIPTSTTFRYIFDVPTCGTYWWHSHAGHLRGDGVLGALVIRQAPSSLDRYGPLNRKVYDFDLPEHELMLGDFTVELVRQVANNFWYSVGSKEPEFILVNGRGVPPGFFKNFKPHDRLPRNNEPFVPLHELRIKKNKSYRIRVINHGTFMCPMHVSVEKHVLEVIATDGVDFVPTRVDSIVLHAGERYDFVLRGDQPVGSYWIKVQGLLDCDDKCNSVYGLAVLNYDEIPAGTYPDHTIITWKGAAPPPGLVLNPLDEAPGVPGKSMILTDLSSLQPVDPEVMTANPDQEFMLAFGINKIDNLEFPGQNVPGTRMVRVGPDVYLPQINHISFLPPSSPPLSQPDILSKMSICNDKNRPGQVSCELRFCECMHVIQIKLNSIVEIVVLDGSDFPVVHPIHMHGYSFHVVGMEKLGSTMSPEEFKERDRNGLIKRKRERAILKDTFALPRNGYVIYRFRANNPGFWFMHCHLELHAEKGMSLIVQVGEPSQMKPTPMDFPRCGSYKPVLPTDSLLAKDSYGVNFDFGFPSNSTYNKLDYEIKFND